MPGKCYGRRVALLVCWEDLRLESRPPQSFLITPGNLWLWFLLLCEVSASAAAEAGCSVRPQSHGTAGPRSSTRERRSCLIFLGAFSPLSMPHLLGQLWGRWLMAGVTCLLSLTGSMPEKPPTRCLSQASQAAPGISETLDCFIP